MLTRKSRLLLSLTAAPLLFVAACTDNTLTTPFEEAVGTYHLTVYQGGTLPRTFTIQPNDPNYPNLPNGGTLVATDGTLVLHSNGSFIETNNYTVTPTGGSPQQSYFVSQGAWDLDGIDLTLQAQGRLVQGTLDLDTINYQELDANGNLQSYEYLR